MARASPDWVRGAPGRHGRPKVGAEKFPAGGLMAKVFPHDSGYMQTVNGRRERLRAALETLVAENGWREVRRDVYSKAGPGESQG